MGSITIAPVKGYEDREDLLDKFLNMYKGFLDKKGLSYNIEKGNKSVSIVDVNEIGLIDLSGEHGYHRAVGLSPMSPNGKRQTAYLQVYIMPVPWQERNLSTMIVRSYISHPYTIIKDHKTLKETDKLNEVFSGEIDILFGERLENGLKYKDQTEPKVTERKGT